MIARSRRVHSARGRPPSANRHLGVETRDLTRVFERSGKRRREAGPVVALDRVTLEVPPGEVHGLLGPNGAGKTTLCKILSTVLLPTSGSARVDGHDVVREAEAVRSVLAIVFGGERGLYLRLTARQSLRYWHALYLQPPATRASRVDEVLELVGLRDRADDPVETYSRGMKQRLHLARGLLADPRVIILDEPTLGMDPVGVRAFRTLVRELCTAGRALLITTHDMDEAEHVCDRVSLIDDGRLIATEDPRTVGSWISRYERVEAEGVSPGLASRLRSIEGVAAVTSVKGQTGLVRIETAKPGTTASVMRLLLDQGVTTIAATRPSLEEVYLRVFGERP